MKKLFILSLAGLLAVACELPKDLETLLDENYNKEWASTFGETDPNHTWSMVDNKFVQIDLDDPARVKIYVKSEKNYNLAGDYENVQGNCELAFDAPAGCTDVYVTVNGVPYECDKAKARGTMVAAAGDVISSTDGDYVYYNFGEIKKFKQDDETLPEYINNTAKVNMDYRVISNGQPYKFYPLFWNADYEHTFGLYYYEGDERKEVDFYADKNPNDYPNYLQYKDSEGNWADIVTDYAYEGIFAQSNIADDEQILRGRYFTINLPKGTEFGFFVNITEEKDGVEKHIGKFYSDPALNQEPNTSFSSFSYLEMDGNTYITIEDKRNGDLDYNDFIFIMEGTQEHIEETPVDYLYAVEDLGGTCDFDFNDIVFSVSHVSGQPHANVKLLAAGGTLPAYICFGDFKSTEVHEMFGVDTKEMVNTAKGTTKSNMIAAKSFTVAVGADWSHSPAFSVKGNGFKVKVKRDKENTLEVETPGAGSSAAPQMLILPEKWLWPTERTRISDAYPSFGEWGANYTNTQWVNNVVNENVVDWVTE